MASTRCDARAGQEREQVVDVAGLAEVAAAALGAVWTQWSSGM